MGRCEIMIGRRPESRPGSNQITHWDEVGPAAATVSRDADRLAVVRKHDRRGRVRWQKQLWVTRSMVHQVVGRCKTEARLC